MFLEKYVIEYGSSKHTIRLMKDGSYKCDCKFYNWGNCLHIDAFKARKVKILSAQRRDGVNP